MPLDNPPRNPNLDQSQAHLQWTMFVAEDMSPPYWSAPILGKGRITVLEARELGQYALIQVKTHICHAEEMN